MVEDYFKQKVGIILSDQLIVNVASFETRIAYIESGLIAEIMIERKAEQSRLGNIYLGKVQRVLPGMQAAFVDLGIEKAAFLFVADVIRAHPHLDPIDFIEEDDEKKELSYEEIIAQEVLKKDEDIKISQDIEEKLKNKPKIEELLKPGQEILVQVTKDSIGTKGPRVSCNISIPGRYVVFMPNYDHIGVSRKILEEEDRDRLKGLLTSKKKEDSGFVARTVALGVSDESILKDCDYLLNMWENIENRIKVFKAPFLVQPELDILLKCARDIAHDSLHRIVIDSEEGFLKVKNFLNIFNSSLVDKIELYEKKEPIFEYYGVEAEINRAMSRKVWLKSGGYLVIDQAEALSVIDVNTGKFVGKRNLEDTILRANLEAVKEVAFQLRLRNIGGMVIVDFIDMESQADKDKVLQALIEALKKDKARCNVVKISELGLVEMTRQRTKESLERMMCESCFYCDGKGNLKSRLTVAYEIFRDLLNRGPVFFEPNIIVHAHPEVVDLIYAHESSNLESIEKKINKRIFIKPRGSFHQEQFDIFGMSVLEK